MPITEDEFRWLVDTYGPTRREMKILYGLPDDCPSATTATATTAVADDRSDGGETDNARCLPTAITRFVGNVNPDFTRNHKDWKNNFHFRTVVTDDNVMTNELKICNRRERQNIVLYSNLIPCVFTHSSEYRPVEHNVLISLRKTKTIDKYILYSDVDGIAIDRSAPASTTRVSVNVTQCLLTNLTAYSLNVETEVDESAESFATRLRQNRRLRTIFEKLTYLNRNFNYISPPECFNQLDDLTLCRKFKEIPYKNSHGILDISRYDFAAHKLDGDRVLLLLTPLHVHVISNKLTLVALHNFTQPVAFYYLCHAEIVDTDIIIIDVLYTLTATDNRAININAVSVLESIAWINGCVERREGYSDRAAARLPNRQTDLRFLPLLSKINGYDVRKNVFYSLDGGSENQWPTAVSVRTDGYLLFAADCIYKIKSVSTIDLKIDLFDWLLFLCETKTITKTKYRKITKTPLTAAVLYEYRQYLYMLKYLLKFYDSAADGFALFTTTVNVDLQYSIKWSPADTVSIWNTVNESLLPWNDQNINLINEKLIWNFLILEFKVDTANKILQFCRVRHKPNCNTLSYINQIL